jgi:O-Antigen ligase
MMDKAITQRETAPSRIGSTLIWISTACMLVLIFIRAMVEHDGFPWWQSDPFIFSPPIVGLTPTNMLMLNSSVISLSALAMVGFGLKRVRISKLSSVLFLFGTLAVCYHAILNSESVDDGANILAIVSVLFVSSHLNKTPLLQQLVIAATLSFPLLLVTIGAYEVFVVHPQTVENYELTRDSFVAARGWAPGSFEQLTYERRLYQADPIVWFGLTNVFASFVGAGVIGFGVLWLKTRKELGSERGGSWLKLAIALCVLLCVTGLVLSGAKGGIGAVLLGTIGFLFISRARIQKSGRMILILCGVVIIGVVMRGIIGERVSELSLLFRSQYMSGSIEMFKANPFIGVGPDGFQDMYSTVKPDLSPEDVSSAHSWIFDLIATLGLGGIAWILLASRIVSRIQPNLSEPHHQTTPKLSDEMKRRILQLLILAIAVSSIISIRFASGAINLELLGAQAVGTFIWGAMGTLLIWHDRLRKLLFWAGAGSAMVLCIHSMIEVTGTWYVSGMLWALIIGSATTPLQRATQETVIDEIPSNNLSLLHAGSAIAAVSMLVGFSVFVYKIPERSNWEQRLTIAAEPASRIAGLRDQLNELEFSPNPVGIREQIALELSTLTNRPVTSSIDQVVEALGQAELQARVFSGEQLILASEIRPTHLPTRIAASQQLLWVASAIRSEGKVEESEILWDRTLDLLETGAAESPGASGLLWIGTVWYGRANLELEDPRRTQWIENAKNTWVQAALRSPHDPHISFKIMVLEHDRANLQNAKDWAQATLQLHEQSRLDPLKGLSESNLSRVQSVLRE